LSGSFLAATASLSGSIGALSGSFLAATASLSGSTSALSSSFLNTSASLSGSISALSGSFLAATASLSGSVSALSSSFLNATASLSGSTSALSSSFLNTSASLSGSVSALSGSFLNTSASLSGSVSALSGSFLNTSSSLSGSISALSGSFLSSTSSLSSSISALSSSFLSYTSSQLVLNGTYALTSSNTFTGNQIIQGTLYDSNTTNATGFTSTAAVYTDGGLRVAKDAYISGSTFIAGNLTVFGTSSISFVTASEFVGLEFIRLNTDLPSLRYAGLNIGDSGSSAGISSSLWYDSQKDNWLVTYANVGAPTSSLLINGPITFNSVGNEVGITPNFLTKGQAGLGAGNDHHITSSQISDDGTTVRIPGSLQVTGSLIAGSLTGSLNGSNLVDASVANAKLTNSSVTINGTSLSLGGTLTQAQTIAGAFSGSAQVNHDATTNYVANQHIDHTTVSVSAGSGLSGGGTIAATRTLTLDTGSVHFLDGVKKELNTEGVVSSSAQIDHNATTNYSANRHIDHTAVSISAGSGLSGGGDISSTRTISLDTASATFTSGVKSKLNADGVVSSSAQIDHNSTTNYSANQHVDHTAVSISAGSGLSGGGTIASTRTLTLDTGSAHFLGGARGAISISDTTGPDGINLTYNSGTGVLSGTLQNSSVTVSAGAGLSGGGGVTLGSSVMLTNAGVTSNVAGTGISVNQGTGAVTITNTGVTSVVAGTGISVNQGTGAVTVTNTITNNNQLTNGAGYITGINSSAVTTALGFTPYNATNPSGYQTTSGQVAKVENTVGGSSAVDLVYGNMADNDQFRLRIGGTSTNAGFVELATADDGTEPILVRQYTGVFSTLARTANLLDGSGNTTFPGDVTAYSSDERLKENVRNIPNALDKVLSLNGVTFDWKQEAFDAGFNPKIKEGDAGVLAQQVQAVLPQAVKPAPFDTDIDGSSISGKNYLTVQYEKLAPLFIEAIKEQQLQIEELKELVNQLINK
jgi:hypothetical protein